MAGDCVAEEIIGQGNQVAKNVARLDTRCFGQLAVVE